MDILSLILSLVFIFLLKGILGPLECPDHTISGMRGLPEAEKRIWELGQVISL